MIEDDPWLSSKKAETLRLRKRTQKMGRFIVGPENSPLLKDTLSRQKVRPLMVKNQKDHGVSRIFDLPVDALTMDQVLHMVHERIVNRGRLQIGVVNVAKVVNMRRNRLLREDVLSSDIILADGSGIVAAFRLLGSPIPQRVPGIDLMFRMLDQGNKHGYRVYCLGASEDISDRVEKEIRSGYPSVQFVGRRNGYFSDSEERSIAKTIGVADPDILFVAMSSPKKENFIARWGEAIGARVIHGVGGSFDVMAGKTQRAPVAWQRIGLEWLYRVKEEPGRMWRRYLVTNTLFLGMLVSELMHRRVLHKAGKGDFSSVHGLGSPKPDFLANRAD